MPSMLVNRESREVKLPLDLFDDARDTEIRIALHYWSYCVRPRNLIFQLHPPTYFRVFVQILK
jgi:hypothetical protein